MMEAQRQRHDPSKNLVGFMVGEVYYAVPIAAVREIANPLPVVELPHAPHSVSGVADYRGDVVPVIDIRARFGLPPIPVTRRTKWIMIDLGSRIVALVVDAVTEVFGSTGAELRRAPMLGDGDDLRGLESVATHDGGLVFVLDTTKLAELTEPLVASGALSSPPPTSLLSKGVP